MTYLRRKKMPDYQGSEPYLQGYNEAYHLGHQDGLGQRCQHHFVYFNTWWGFLLFAIIVNGVGKIASHLLGVVL